MYAHSLFSIVTETGSAVRTLTREMRDENELFASSLTLRAVEAHLLIMAHTLAQMPPEIHRTLLEVDWNGWQVLHDTLRNGIQPRREEIWYAVNALVPQTVFLLESLRHRQPGLFPSNF